MNKRASVVVEEYLQAIFALSAEGNPIKSITLVKWLKSSPSTVHATLSRMQRDRLITFNKKKEIHLTAEGSKKAESLTRRHRLVEWFLCETLGISWHEVHKHAHVMEHCLTPLIEEKLAEFLGYPKSCPHGTPLPGEKNSLPKHTKSLDSFESGDSVVIVNIGEVLEESLELMKFFQDHSIRPGKKHNIANKTDITQTLILNSGVGTVTLTYEIATKIGAIKV